MVDPNTLDTWQAIEDIRRLAPVVHNITNFVVMNNTANALLALGASPVMAHAEEEMAEMVGIASALVINLGTLSGPWIKAMFLAAEQATARGIPIVLDPVGAGATSYRTGTARELMTACRPAIIRGNGSEIMAVCGDQARTRGVDSTQASDAALAAAEAIHATWGSVVCISGATDFVVGGRELYRIRNGHPMMTRVTGLGCTASALCGAFAAVGPDDCALAAARAMVTMGVAGELAAAGAEGPGTLQLRFLDALYRLGADDLARLARTGA